ncbi:hypothetical protein FACS18948_6040 [Clostridia bacterium]|nr:hypothetical protein FACS18948_6040 [Clostridia bacterium]
MARRRRRPVSIGTYLMLTIAAATIALSGWIFLRLAGDLNDITIDTASIIQSLVVSSSDQPAATSINYSVVTAPEPTPSPTPAPPPESKRLTLTAGGQIYLDSTLRKAGLNDGGYYFDDIFAQITPYMNKSDITMVTLESTVTESGSYGTYIAPAAILSALKTAGVDIINLATERILDGGLNGLATTRTIAEQLGFSVTGAHRSADEQRLPLTFEVNGIKVAVLSYTYGLSSEGDKKGSSSDRAIAVNIMNAETIRADVMQARNLGANLVIVNTHWGKRADTKAGSQQTRLIDNIIDCGADLILGTHPLTVHKFDKQTLVCADGVTRDVFVAYSLGDFMVNERSSSAEVTGVLLTLEYELADSASSVTLKNSTYMPTWLMRWETDKYYYKIIPAGTTSKPEVMTDTIYRNMRRAYEDLLKKNGSDFALPIPE